MVYISSSPHTSTIYRTQRLLRPVSFHFASLLSTLDQTRSIWMLRVAVEKLMYLCSLLILHVLHESTLDRGPNKNLVPFARYQNLRLVQRVVVNRMLTQNTSLNLICFIWNWRKADCIGEAIPLRRQRESRLKVVRFLIMRLQKLPTNRIRRRVLPYEYI